MVNQTGPCPAPAAPSRAEAQRMFRRMLAAWVLDCANLRRCGLDRPSLGAGSGAPVEGIAGPARPGLLRGG